VLSVNSEIPVGRIKPLTLQLNVNLRQELLIARLSTVFGALALVLASIGLYGVLSHAVAQRTGEIGIRMALGAERATVVRMVLRETGVLIALGLAVGVPASLASARWVESKLFGLKPADPLTLAVAIAVMLAVGAVAGWLPARRASRVDPLSALRYE
jgi:ABC-type antimicrobial peptide transport system permease subunit